MDHLYISMMSTSTLYLRHESITGRRQSKANANTSDVYHLYKSSITHNCNHEFNINKGSKTENHFGVIDYVDICCPHRIKPSSYRYRQCYSIQLVISKVATEHHTDKTN